MGGRVVKACAWCNGALGMVRDSVKGVGDMHPDCAKAYRLRFPTRERPSTLPKHLR